MLEKMGSVQARVMSRIVPEFLCFEVEYEKNKAKQLFFYPLLFPYFTSC